MKILVVEDETKVANALKDGLEDECYQVTLSHTGEDAFYRVSTQTFDIIILDLMLPGRSGMEILQSIRERGLQTPVLVLTAKDAVEDRVRGLDQGADDYLVKPFAFPELTARIRALLRRNRSDEMLRFVCEDLEMDLISREVARRNQSLELTRREFELLEYLLRYQGQTVSREMLARDVWEVTSRATPLDNVIEVSIARLRRKVDDPFEEPLIHTVRGIGYVLKRETS